MSQDGLTLSGLEIFFIITTIASLVFNVMQWREKRASLKPLQNLLLALFNDIKSKANGVNLIYNSLWSPNNPHQDIDTLKWEYGLFAQSMTGYLLGFQETVVGALVTLDPKDLEGNKAFRAQTYGLTEQERKWRDENLEKWMSQSLNQPESEDAKNPELVETGTDDEDSSNGTEEGHSSN